MVLWPVRAALEAGAGRVVVVDSPERALERGAAGGGASWRCRPRRTAPAARSRRRWPQLDSATGSAARSSAPVRGPQRGRAARQRGGDRGLIEAHRAERRGGHDGDDDARGSRAATGAWCATPTGRSSGWSRPRSQGDSTAGRARDPRGEHGHLRRSTAHALREALPRLSADNAQGELYLPQVLDLLRADGARVAAHRRRPAARARRQRPRRRSRSVRRLAQRGDPRAPHARRRGDRRPGRHGHRRGRGDRPGHRDRAVHDDPGQHEDRRAAARSGTPISSTACSRTASASGPFAYLRPGTRPARGRQGGHVRRGQELRHRRRARKSRTSPTSATPTWASGTNLGAATITANYDGRAKHRTTIGSRVRDGVDTTLVAPVTVGDDAYTGGRLGDHRRRARRARSAIARARQREHRGLRRARASR